MFKNVNHKNMLHKHFVFEHIYIILILTLILSIYQLLNGNYLMPAIIFIGGTFLMLKLFKGSEVPYRLIFDGLSIYEINHLGKRIVEFNPSKIQSSDENDFIFISTSKEPKRSDEKMKSLIIMEDYEFKVKEFIHRYFSKFEFNNFN